MMQHPASGLELRSLVTPDGTLRLSLESVSIGEPAADDVIVEVQATPINPSDLGLLLGAFGAEDLNQATVAGTGTHAVLTAPISPRFMRAMAGRVGESMAVGNEGAGRVVAAGASPAAQALLGKTVAMAGGAMYATFRKLRAANCMELPNGATAADGASSFVNPMTALGMLETMRAEGHTALVHTAAASNLGLMLNRLCIADGIGLINVVRSAAQAATLVDAGATYVCDMSVPAFRDDLHRALEATKATLVFDAIGGGRLLGDILAQMEAVAAASEPYSRYGSTTLKQGYIYGALDTGPTELSRAFGFKWNIGGWLLTYFLQEAAPATAGRMRARVLAELTTTFASRYTKTIPLSGVLDLENLKAISRRATGEKYLIDPSLDAS